LALGTAGACVPPGNSTPTDSGAPSPTTAAAPTFKASVNVMTAPFLDNFDRTGPTLGPPLGGDAAPTLIVLGADAAAPPGAKPDAARPLGDASAADALLATAIPAEAAAAPDPEAEPLGPDWLVTQPSRRAWRIENGKLCGQNAQNHGVWLKRTLPVNARIEFDAISYADDGDLKTEVWGDGASAATSVSYTNATSYLAILGGWKNTYHVLARINEHGNDRKEIKVDPTSDDERQKPVVKGQQYHFKIERTDGRTVRFLVNDVEYLTFNDPNPLIGAGHDHFGFNEWAVKVCFDNVKVTPL
jgi:hypothetical protein